MEDHTLALGVHSRALDVHMLVQDVRMLVQDVRKQEWEMDDKALVRDMLELEEDDKAQVGGILVLDVMVHKDLKCNYRWK